MHPIVTALFVMGIFIGGGVFSHAAPTGVLIPLAYAEDDDEAEYEDEEGTNEVTSPQPIPEVKIVPTYETVLVTKIITTLDPIFTTDQDRDQLVDGLDPHPTIHEREYFTDDDDDSVPNAFDRYPDDDDFVYYEEESDENENGILDSYEAVEER